MLDAPVGMLSKNAMRYWYSGVRAKDVSLVTRRGMA